MKKLLSTLLILCMTLTMLPQLSMSASASGTTYQVASFAALQSAISSAVDGDIIDITAPIDVTATLVITKSLTFTASGDGKLTRGSSFTSGSLFNINGIDKTVTFQNITIDGNNVVATTAGIYISSGTLVFETGMVLQNCRSILGAGVYIKALAAFVMNNGSISGNTATDSGGGVYLENYSTFTMNNGSISGNTATNSGGGVYLYNNSTFTMNNGSISGNTATDSGGGVWLDPNSTFTMNNGSISGNTATDSGGGVWLDPISTFTMNNGSISGNTADYRGGGVYLMYYSTFAMNNGSISGNTAGDSGGGVRENGNATFKVSGNVQISGNIGSNGSTDNLYMYYNSVLTLTGALANTAVIGVARNTSPTTGNPVVMAVSDAGYTGGLTSDDAAKFTSDNASYHIGYDSVNHKVVLATPPVAAAINETAQTVTYNGSPQAFAITGTPNTGYGIVYKQGGSEVTPTDVGTYDVEITRAADISYNAYSKSIPGGLTINKATPTIITPPTASDIASGNALSTSALTGGSASAAGTFSWVAGTTIPATGTNSYSVTFTPDDLVNYNTVTTNVSVTAYTTPTIGAIPNQPTILTGADLNNTLTLPAIENNGFIIVKQGWQSSPNGTSDWQDIPNNSTCSAGVNGYYIRYYVLYKPSVNGVTNIVYSPNTEQLVINRYAPALVLTVAPASPQIDGTVITLQAAISGASSVVSNQGYLNTVPVIFKDGTTTIGTATIAAGTGIATVTTSALTIGDHTFMAEFPGESDYNAPATSNVVNYTIIVDPDIAIVATAKANAESANYVSITQAEATNEAVIADTLKATADTAVSNSSVTTTINKVSYTPPVAGTSANPSGTDGTYIFTVTVAKGTQTLTIIQKSIAITATAFTGISDDQAVAAAKSALNDGTVEVAFGANQATKTAAVQSYVDDMISSTANAAGITATVAYNSATGKYDVMIVKGSQSSTKSLTMTVNVAPDPDIATVASANTAAQNASYSDMTQAQTTNEAAIVSALKATAEAAVNNSVTTTINKVSYTAPLAGTAVNPVGTNGSYTFTVTLAKGAQSQTTVQKTITITATAFTGITDVQAVAATKVAIVNSSVNVAYGADQAAKTAAVQTYVDSIISNTESAAGVTATVTYNSTTGNYDIAITKGSESDSKSLTMTVIIAPDPDIATVDTAKSAAQNASYSDMTQAQATNEAAIVSALKATAEAAVNNNNVTTTINEVSYTAPVAGTSDNPNGTNGSFSFTVTITKDAQTQTTEQKTLTILATTFSGATDDQAVAAAKNALNDSNVNVPYGADQAVKTAAVQTYVNGVISGTVGVAATVTYNSTTEKYDVTITKGSASDTKSLTMTVNIASDPDIATVGSAKTAAENVSYSNLTQMEATSEAAIVSALKAEAEAAVNNSSVTTTINKVSYTAPVAGTSANPNGTNGSFTFTVTMTKDAQTQTTEQKTITIAATTFTGVTDVQAVATAKTNIAGGSYTMTQATANTSDAVKTELARQINALSGMSGTGITVTASDITLSFTAATAGSSGNTAGTNGSFSFTVALMKGVVTDTTASKTGTVTATTYTDNSGNGGNNNGGGNNSNNQNTSNTDNTTKPEGTVEKDQQCEEGAPKASINSSTTNLKESVLTTEEQVKVAAGEDAKVILKIEDISTTVSEEDKKLIEEKLNTELLNTEEQGSGQPNTEPVVMYVDISLFKQVGSGEATRVTETSDKISISIEVPQELWNSNGDYSRTYHVVRIHDNVVETLDGTYDSQTHLFTFETDRFSVYALTYQDTMNDTTDNTDNSTVDSGKDNITVYNDFYHLRLTAKATNTAQTLSYAKMSGADGYLIYGAKCGQELKELADVAGTVTGYTVKNLKQATYYKYQVKAYKIINGEKVIIATSKIIHTVTTSKTYADPTKITTDVTSFILTEGETNSLDCQVVLPKNMKMKEHTVVIRFESTDKKIATVSSSGKIIAKSKGTCYVYVYAQNGVYKKIKVTVE